MELIQSVKKPTSLHKDFVRRCLRSEAQFLLGLLKNAERSEWPEDSYIEEALRMAIDNLKGLRKYLSH